jgi:hypothetical protein
MSERLTPPEADHEGITEPELSPYDQALGLVTGLATEVSADYPKPGIGGKLVLRREDRVSIQLMRFRGVAGISVHGVSTPEKRGASVATVSQYYAEFLVGEDGVYKPSSVTVQRRGSDNAHEVGFTEDDLLPLSSLIDSYHTEKARWAPSEGQP